ncbi:MAG: hypothetical protein KAR39_12765 [Thermoplasmata archaeon]|nr:hypothetical protein [Thermoplasmata archaeon]
MGRQERGTIQIAKGLCDRLDRIISSGRFGIGSRARAVEMACNEWLMVYESKLLKLEKEGPPGETPYRL